MGKTRLDGMALPPILHAMAVWAKDNIAGIQIPAALVRK
jgi:hypothetical protein